ncbi:MAG TPA: hypothetical protein VN753_14890 [Terracidiphilus sp.]|nr:hypothetical protein [Terracidiphilus sp.]
MKILRSVSQRGFSVGTAGWFTILRPNTWFPASRLPGTFRNSGPEIRGAAESTAGQSALAAPANKVWEIRGPVMERRPEDRDRVRSASIILGAMAITSALLWWICIPR